MAASKGESARLWYCAWAVRGPRDGGKKGNQLVCVWTGDWTVPERRNMVNCQMQSCCCISETPLSWSQQITCDTFFWSQIECLQLHCSARDHRNFPTMWWCGLQPHSLLIPLMLKYSLSNSFILLWYHSAKLILLRIMCQQNMAESLHLSKLWIYEVQREVCCHGASMCMRRESAVMRRRFLGPAVPSPIVRKVSALPANYQSKFVKSIDRFDLAFSAQYWHIEFVIARLSKPSASLARAWRGPTPALGCDAGTCLLSWLKVPKSIFHCLACLNGSASAGLRNSGVFCLIRYQVKSFAYLKYVSQLPRGETILIANVFWKKSVLLPQVEDSLRENEFWYHFVIEMLATKVQMSLTGAKLWFAEMDCQYSREREREREKMGVRESAGIRPFFVVKNRKWGRMSSDFVLKCGDIFVLPSPRISRSIFSQ